MQRLSIHVFGKTLTKREQTKATKTADILNGQLRGGPGGLSL